MPTLTGLTTNFFATPNEGFTTTTSAPVDSSSATVVPFNSVSGLTNGSIFTGLIDPGNAKERAFTGVVDTGGSQITSVKFTTGTNATHTTGATIVDYVTGTHFGAMAKGILISHDQDGTLKAGAVDNAGVVADGILTDVKFVTDTLTESKIKVSTASSLRSPNLLYNGNMNVWQRNVTATPNDDVYTGADRWNFLTETNGAWTVARDTDVPVGSQYSMKFTNVTLNNQCGIVQILENLDSKQLDDGVVSLSFYAKTSGTEIANLRAGIITWGSTADAVTSDVFSAWAQDGTNPTLAANWTYENTPSNLALTSTWTRYTIDNVAIDTATVNNVAVVIWTDDGTIAANDDFWITQVQLNYGAKNAAFQHRTYAEELALCYRYLHVITTVGSNQSMGFGWAPSTTLGKTFIPLCVRMRGVPTLTATASDWQLADSATAGLDITAIAMSTDPLSLPDGLWITSTVSGATQYRPYALRDDGAARTMIFEAEL